MMLPIDFDLVYKFSLGHFEVVGLSQLGLIRNNLLSKGTTCRCGNDERSSGSESLGIFI